MHIIIQMLLVVSQSVVLGYLTDYFSIQDPLAEDTRNAYLYALGSYGTYFGPITKLMVTYFPCRTLCADRIVYDGILSCISDWIQDRYDFPHHSNSGDLPEG